MLLKSLLSKPGFMYENVPLFNFLFVLPHLFLVPSLPMRWFHYLPSEARGHGVSNNKAASPSVKQGMEFYNFVNISTYLFSVPMQGIIVPCCWKVFAQR